jgi:hypothetical protein
VGCLGLALVLGLDVVQSRSVGANARGTGDRGEIPPTGRTYSTGVQHVLVNPDIALLNLVAGQDLTGTAGVDAGRSQAELDAWAARAKTETERHLYRFRQNPAEYEHSEGYFRMLMLAVVVCEDFGVRYNPGRISTPGQSLPFRGTGVAPVSIPSRPSSSAEISPSAVADDATAATTSSPILATSSSTVCWAIAAPAPVAPCLCFTSPWPAGLATR